jgi:hypothetical protein
VFVRAVLALTVVVVTGTTVILGASSAVSAAPGRHHAVRPASAARTASTVRHRAAATRAAPSDASPTWTEESMQWSLWAVPNDPGADPGGAAQRRLDELPVSWR